MTTPPEGAPPPVHEDGWGAPRPQAPQPPLCIWHKGCVDGWTSAWVVRNYFGPKVDLWPGVYGEPPPDTLVAGRNVLMVDFSYKRNVIEDMRGKAKSIMILDHHKTAEEDLALYAYSHDWAAGPYFPRPGECFAVFDMEQSGAGLCWRFLFPRAPLPKLVQHVQDRDLWLFRLNGTAEINLVLYSHDFTFENWDAIADRLERPGSWEAVVMEGGALNRQHMKTCRALVHETMKVVKIGGVLMPACNAPYMFASEMGNLMAREPQNTSRMAACWYERGDGRRVFSLRSVGEADVSEIAKRYGGGGHRNAAGFTVDGNWLGDA